VAGDSDDFDFDKGTGKREGEDLHGAAGRLIRLILCTKVLRVSAHKSGEIHFAALGGVAGEVGVHHDHVTEGKVLGRESSLNSV
jgi:hypothetical protein